MPITASGTTEFADAIPELWLNQALLAFREGSVLLNGLVTVDYGAGATDYASPGDTYYKNTFGDEIAVQDKDEYEEYVSDAMTVGKVPLVFNQHPYLQWKNTEFSKIMSLDFGMATIRDNIPKLIARVENDLLAQYTNAGSYVGVSGTPITKSTVLAARRKFVEANVPRDRPWALVIGASDEESLLSDLSDASTTGDNQALRNAHIGGLLGFNVYSTNRIPTAAGVNYNLALHPEAITIAIRPMAPPVAPNVMSRTLFDPTSGLSFRWMAYYDPDEGTWISRVEMLYGIKTFRGAAMTQVRS